MISSLNNLDDNATKAQIIKELSSFVDEEDIIFFLRILNKLNKSNINKLLKILNNPTHSKQNEIKNSNILFSNEKIIEVFNEYSDEEIIKNYRLDNLRSMYEALYSNKIATNKTKKDIIDIIRSYIRAMERVEAFKL